MNIDKTLTKAYNASGRHQQIGVLVGDRGYTRSNGYFFLQGEIGMKTRENEKQLIRDKRIRHMIINPKGYYDYIAKKQFTKFEDWVDDCGVSMLQILYGRNDVDTPAFNWNLGLFSLLNQVGPIFDPVPVPNPVPAKEEMVNVPLKILQNLKRTIDDIGEFHEDSLTAKLSKLNISVEDLYVVQGSQIVKLQELMPE